MQTMRTGGRRVPVSANGLGQVLGKRQPAGGQGPGRLSANRAERKLLSALELDSTWGLRQPFRARGCNGGRVGIPSRTRGRSSGAPSAFPEVRGAASLNPHPQLRGSYSLTTVLLHGGENSTAKKTQVNQSRYSFLTSAPEECLLNFALELLFPAGSVVSTFHTPLEQLSVQLSPLDCELLEGKACVMGTAMSPGTALAPRIQR